eukprot:4842084-Alexandrium_andersonii.AAC.1
MYTVDALPCSRSAAHRERPRHGFKALNKNEPKRPRRGGQVSTVRTRMLSTRSTPRSDGTHRANVPVSYTHLRAPRD